MAVSSPRPRTAATIVGLIVALGSPFLLPLITGRGRQSILDVRQDGIIVAFEWTVAIVILGLILPWERLPLRSIGFRMPSFLDVGAMALALVAMWVTVALFVVATHASTNEAPAVEIARIPLLLRVTIFLTAGFCEELLFRAYAVERLALLTGSMWIAGAISVGLFTLGHVPRYGFSPSLAIVAIIGAFLTALYLWRRNFWVCAGMHAIVDCVGLVIAPAVATHAH
jgi:membrane protease YdiL (CAAX protease family)